MKNIVLMCAASVFMIIGANAQENKEVKEVSTVKKVVKRDTKVDVKVVKETETEKGTIVVEGTDKQDQNSKVVTKKMDDVEVIADEVMTDPMNTMKANEIQNKTQMQLKASIAAQKAEAEKERKALEEKKMQMMKELEARRAALTARPKGMAKLDTKKQ